MSVVTSKFESKFVLLYTTAGISKPSYRQGILDALCYPNGHIITYSYRGQHLRPEFVKDTALLRDKSGIIIFVDFDSNKTVTYFPLRRVKICNVSVEAGTIKPPAARERVAMSLLLQEFVDYSGEDGVRKWHQRVQKFDDQRHIVNGIPRYFVVPGADEFPPCGHSLSLGWEDLVDSVSKSSNFQDAIFVRLDHIRPADSDEEIHQQVDRRLVYQLRPGSMYRLDLSVFEKFTKEAPGGKATTITISASDKDALGTDKPFQSIVSGLAEKSSLISCKRTIEDIVATIGVNVESDKTSGPVVNSPNPTLFVRISVSGGILAAFVVCIILGSFGVAVDKDIVAQVLNTWHADFWTLVIKGAGALLLAVAAFLVFRKLPSGK